MTEGEEPGGPARRADPHISSSAGLCARCRHARSIETGRGSRFVLCERSRREPAFPRYPSLPVLHCAGFEVPGEVPAD